MANWIDIVVKQEQYKDLLREAERERLVRAARAGRRRRSRVAGPLLAWLGSLLIALGRRLQARFGPLESNGATAFDHRG